ncbi:putative bifunctional diguanylate cyclase/phosphodiesterase [Thiocapsa imhoffii]|nr:EAL domain-containing protein [Thiocapsa imhoffii]
MNLSSIQPCANTADQDSVMLETLLGLLPHGVALIGADQRIQYLNRAAETLFGRHGDEARSLSIGDLLPEFDGIADFRRAEDDTTDAPVSRRLQAVHVDGRHRPVRVLMHPIDLGAAPGLLLVIEDLTEQERSARRLAFLEHRDPLTGLHNRTTFEGILGAVVPFEACDEAQPTHAICLIDIDRFKVVNETFGAAAGNKLLEQLGRIIRARLNSAAAVARLSGDEFAALFIGPAAQDARERCEELITTTRHFLFSCQDRTFSVTVSIGMVVFDPERVNAVRALGQADIACRVAKEKGRDRLHLFNDGDAETIRHRDDMVLIPLIGDALSQGRFQIVLQPILPLQEPDAPTHYEILVRMKDEHGHILGPDAFIGAAERHILMPAIDRWIINHVFSHQAEQLRAWKALYPNRCLLAINLSGTTLMDDSFASYLRRQFREYEVPYSCICFEITETAAVLDLPRAQAMIEEFHALGCSFAVDDFGTGFASYTYLKLLPVDYLKIDGSFVRQLATDPVDHALVSSIHHLGRILGLKTIAEWAETPHIIEILREMGVDYAQGFGVGPSLRLEDLVPGQLNQTGPSS